MYQVIDVKKQKNRQQIKDVDDHNLRETHSRNVDKKKTKDNKFYVGSPKMDSIAVMEEHLKKCPKYRKDANINIKLVLSASPEFFQNSTKKQVEEWEKDTQKWIEDTFGKDNLIYSVVHNDEKTKHFHVSFTPIAPDGKLNSGYWFDGPAKLKKLHDSYNKITKKYGLRRGKPLVKPTQTELDSYYKIVSSSTAYDRQLDKKLDDLLEGIKSPSLLDRFNWSSFVENKITPMVKQLKTNLHHYRTKYEQAKEHEKENKFLKARVQDLECKFESLGLNPDTPHIELNELSPSIKKLVEEKSKSINEPVSSGFQDNPAPEKTHYQSRKPKI